MANSGTVNNGLPPGFVVENNDSKQQTTDSGGNLPTGFQAENTEQPQRSAVATVATPLAAAAGVGFGGAALHGIGKWANTPYRIAHGIDKQLQDIANQNIKSTTPVSTDDLPRLLTDKYNSLKANIVQPSLDAIDKNITIQKSQLRNTRSMMDTQQLNPLADNISKHIAANYKPVINAAYQQYRNNQNQIEDIIEKSGKPIQSSDVSTFLNKAMEDAIQQGVPKERLAVLEKLASSFDNNEGVITDLLGNPLNTSEPIPFSQLKGNVGYLLNKLPDNAKHVVASNWSDYLGQSIPQEANQLFQDMQAKYSKFAPARNTLFSLIDPKKEIFDTNRLSSRLRALVKTNQDAGLTDLINTLGNGSEITPAMPGLNEKMSTLNNFSSQRNNIAKQLTNLDTHRATVAKGIADIDKQLQDAYKQHTALMEKTNTLLSQKSAIPDQYPVRTIISEAMHPAQLAGSVVKKLIGIGKGTLMGMPGGVVQGELMNRAVGYDPTEAFQKWLDLKMLNPNNPNDASKIDTILDKLKNDAQNGMQT